MSVYESETPFTRSHLYLELEPRYIPYYEWNEESGIFTIVDPVWNRGEWSRCEIGKEPGDEVLISLLHNDLVRRTMAIEQLTLDPLTETIPGAAEFSRWEHIWGSVAFVRMMTKDMDLTSEQRLQLQLRTFLSDLGHTAYSHLGDWLFQGVGGNEDQHDTELIHLLEISGINDILRDYDIDPDDVVFPNVEDWIESPAPDLCVDRVDYGVREILRWANLSMGVWMATRPDAFKVTNDGKLVCKGEENALNLAKAFMLLPTEHWGEPVHRLQLHLKQELVKFVLTNEWTGLVASNMSAPDDYHPRDYIYSIDPDITYEMAGREPFLGLVRPLMQDIGLARRRMFSWERKQQLEHFFSQYKDPLSYPDPLKPYGDIYTCVDVLPSNVEIIKASSQDKVGDYKKNKFTYDVWLPGLKPRAVDPLFEDSEGNIRRLSEVNETYKGLMKKQRKLMSQAYVGRLLLNRGAKKTIVDGVKSNDEKWQEALTRPRMDPAQFKRLLYEIAQLAVTKSLVRLGGRFYT